MRDVITIVLDETHRPKRMVLHQRSYVVLDDPTRWTRRVAVSPSHQQYEGGWRFTACDTDGDGARVFDVAFNEASSCWEVVATYE